MIEVAFLIVIGLVYLLFASITDLKTREVPNWLSFSLIVFALGARFFYSLFSEDWNFLFQGVIGLGLFFVLGNVFYYGRIFAGGDAKLFIALGAVLGFYPEFFNNIGLYGFFVFLIFLIGAFYGFIWSGYLSYKNFSIFKKKFNNNLLKSIKVFYVFFALAGLFFIAGFFEWMFFVYGFFCFVFPFIYVYAKAVDEGCMIKEIPVEKLTEGDWLYESVSVGKGKKTLEPDWEGVSFEDIEKIKKHHKKIKIREGLPFVPVFLISFVVLCFAYFSGFLQSYLFSLGFGV